MSVSQDKKQAIIHEAGPNVLRHSRDGLMLYNQSDYYMARSFEVLGEYSKPERDFLCANLRTGDAVVEVGANIGSHSIAMAQKVGRQGILHVYEPQHVIFQTLCANIALNGLTNVRSWNYAAGSENGDITVPNVNYDTTGNFGGISLLDQDVPGYQVPMVRLDDHLDLGALRLIKVDVEGMERDVLEGASGLIDRFQPLLYVENNLRDKSPALISWILGRDYKLYWHFPALWSADNFYGATENPFVSPSGLPIISVNMIAIPGHMKAPGFEKLQITDPNAWWQKDEL